MKASNIIASTLMVMSLGLTACGVAKDKKNADNMQAESGQIAAELNHEGQSLRTENIYLGGTYSSYLNSKTEWDKKTPEKRAELRKRLTNVIQKSSRYLEIAAHKHIRADAKSISLAQQFRDNAKTQIEALDRAEKGQSSAGTPTPEAPKNFTVTVD